MKYALFAIVALAVAVFATVSGGERYITVTQAQEPPPPQSLTAVNGPNLGTATLTWTTVQGVSSYRVGWLAKEDFLAYRENDIWEQKFAYSDVIASSTYTVARLTPGADYYLIVGRKHDSDIAWSGWQELTLNADESSCPTDTTGTTQPPTTVVAGDYDADNDGLIEIRTLAQLDAIRYDLDGDGRSQDSAYVSAFANARSGMGCPSPGCSGYELTADIDFGSLVTSAGWLPIGNSANAFIGTFQGNGFTISNLYISRLDSDNVGLFGSVGTDGRIYGAKLRSVSVIGGSRVGGLAGYNAGAINRSSVTGTVVGGMDVGGLVGYNTGSVANSSSTADVTGTGERGYVGGLVGSNVGGTLDRVHSTGEVRAENNPGGLAGINTDGTIIASFSSGNVHGYCGGGGLVYSNDGGKITASYASGDVRSSRHCGSGGLARYNDGSITASYATGDVIGRGYRNSSFSYDYPAGFVSYNEGPIIASYSTGELRNNDGSMSSYSRGFTGRGDSNLVSASYWDSVTSGRTSSAGGEGKTTAELQSPTGTTGIYADWNSDWWDFGNSGQYPVLKVAGHSVANQRR